MFRKATSIVLLARISLRPFLCGQDWFADADSSRWSYYAARLRGAAALSPNAKTGWGGYIVPRSSGQFDGGLLQRALTLVGSGSKLLKYFTFGPEFGEGMAFHLLSRLLAVLFCCLFSV